MSRVVAVVHPKKGVGKTTTALSIAQAFALGGQGALLVDFDEEEGVSRHLGIARARSAMMARILRGEEEASSIGLLVRSVVAGLDVIPGDITSREADLPDSCGPRLGEALHVLRFQYPWCVIDCPSAEDGWVRAAVMAADTVIIPVEAELFARETTAAVLEDLEGIRQEVGEPLDLIRIVMTKFRDRNSLSADVRRDLMFEYPELLSLTVIPHDQQVVESSRSAKPLLQFSLECRASRAYVQFAKEVMTHGRTQAR